MASPTIVKLSPGGNSSGATSLGAFSGGVTAGSLLLAIARIGANTVNTVTDSQGNAYSAVVTLQHSTSSDQAVIYQAVAGSSAACTITVTPNGGATVRGFGYEISGANSTATATATGQGSSNTPITGNLVVPDADSLIIACCLSSGNAEFTAGSGYAKDLQVPAAAGTGRMAGESQAVGAATFTPDFALDGSNNWVIVAASWKSAGGGGGGVFGQHYYYSVPGSLNV